MANDFYIDLPVEGGGGGSGTVTSVNFTASPSSVFDVSGVPITTSGTIALSMDSQSANTVLAGPTSGGAVAPAFRTLVAGDIPSLPYASTTLTSAHIFVGNGSNVATDVAVTGDIAITNGGVTSYSGTVALNKGGTGQTTKAAAFDALSPMTAAGDIIYGGASGTGTKLSKGTALQVLRTNSGATAPEWATIITDWVSFTPTGGYTTNTTYTGWWRRDGDTIYVQVTMSFAGAPNNVDPNINLPTGATIDTSKMTATGANLNLGSVSYYDDSAGAVFMGWVCYETTTSVRLQSWRANNAAGATDRTTPITVANLDKYIIIFSVPCSTFP